MNPKWETVGMSYQLTTQRGIFCVFESIVAEFRGEWCLMLNDDVLGYFQASRLAIAEAEALSSPAKAPDTKDIEINRLRTLFLAYGNHDQRCYIYNIKDPRRHCTCDYEKHVDEISEAMEAARSSVEPAAGT